MIGRAAVTVVAVNLSAAVATALAGSTGLLGAGARDQPVVSRFVELTGLLGVVGLVYVLPSFVTAALVARAAARRSRPYGYVLACVLLLSVPMVGVGPAFVAGGPDVLTYLTLLYGGGFVLLSGLVRDAAARGRDRT